MCDCDNGYKASMSRREALGSGWDSSGVESKRDRLHALVLEAKLRVQCQHHNFESMAYSVANT